MRHNYLPAFGRRVPQANFHRRVAGGQSFAGTRRPGQGTPGWRITVRHALDLLAEEGLIARHRDRRISSVICQPLDRRWFTLALNLNELERHSAAITVSEIDSRPWHRPLPVAAEEGCSSAGYHRVVHLRHHKDYRVHRFAHRSPTVPKVAARGTEQPADA